MALTPYLNLSGKSGITAYETGRDYLIVEFTDGSRYLYNDEFNGKEIVDGMKILAEAGQGLSTFIARYMRDQHAKKL